MNCQFCGNNEDVCICQECLARTRDGQVPVICTSCQESFPALPALALTWIPPGHVPKHPEGAIHILFSDDCAACRPLLPGNNFVRTEVANA